MKVRFVNKRGIALVITLVMLAVVTVMAIVFLAVTRRERTSVILAEETAIAKDMADAALERAKTEAVGGMNANGSKLHYDLFNSQAFYNPNGFDPSLPRTNINVAPVRDWPGIRQNGREEYLELLSNLQYDPAVPVFVETNQNGQGDFRFYLDFNRNRQFETNGFLYNLDASERPIVEQLNGQNVTNFYRFVGDPEWIGVLARPDLPHSETNRFVGRMAYLVLPAGKSLDLNYIHNQVNGSERLDVASAQNGFSRSQGIGSWELNLAAFLRELNGNSYAWRPQTYNYQVSPNQPPTAVGDAFNDARALLSFRYDRRTYLKSMLDTLGRDNMLNPITSLAVFERYRKVNNNNIDDFGDRPYLANNGEIFFPVNQAPLDTDDPDLDGWPGSMNTNAFTDLQQLFSAQIGSPGFLRRLQVPAMRVASTTGRSSYDRYTFYRLAGQLGTDSTPALDGRIHLNYQNPIGMITNTTIPWTNAVEFFTNAAELMLRASIDEIYTINATNLLDMIKYQRPAGTYYRIGDTLLRTNETGLLITNIQVAATNFAMRGITPYMTQNEYTPTIHRILQVAANIYDNMNDKAVNGPAYHPTVFAPILYKDRDRVTIRGFQEVTNNAPAVVNRPWAAFSDVLRNTNNSGFLTGSNYYGAHFVIGTKKGHPNFNEVAFRANVDLSRKLALTRQNFVSTNMAATNQMFIVNMFNRWAMEAWNPYTNIYNKSLTITGHVSSTIALKDFRDGTNAFVAPAFWTNITAGGRVQNYDDWPAAKHTAPTNFVVAFDTSIAVIPEASYSTFRTPRFGPTNAIGDFNPIEPTPQFVLYTTNRAAFWMLDESSGRLIDFVSYDGLTTEMDLRKYLFTPPQPGQPVDTNNVPTEEMFWDPTPIAAGSVMTVGHSNQLAMSAGQFDETATGRGRSDALWRSYRYNIPQRRYEVSVWRKFLGLPMRAQDDADVRVPAILTHQAPFTPTRRIKWEYWWQANDPFVHYMHEDLWLKETREAISVFQNTQQRWNIGLRNDGYQPWGGNPDQQQQQVGGQQDAFAYNVAIKDPGIRIPDDWQFPVSRRSTENDPNNTNYFFPNIGTLGQVHRGTPWQTLYLKSIYRRNPAPGPGKPDIEIMVTPSQWTHWAGTIGNYPSRDWRLLDVFTAAANENAARGLLGVNQTNSAAWAAVLGGVIVPETAVTPIQALRVTPPDRGYDPALITPGSAQFATIVRSIIEAHTNQFEIMANPNPRHPSGPNIIVPKTNFVSGQPAAMFEHMGDVLGAPALSVQNPYIRGWLGPVQSAYVQNVWTDQAIEYIPQQILSLLRRDEPRFVVYAFGQSLKPAPGSLSTDADYYHLCTNYQITGEVITKTTFRVEGRPRSRSEPLKTVVEKYEILPPPE